MGAATLAVSSCPRGPCGRINVSAFPAVTSRPAARMDDAVSRDRLDTELARTHALLSVRLVAEDGSERVRLERARIPIGEKQRE